MNWKRSFRKTSYLNSKEIFQIWQEVAGWVNLKGRNQVKYETSKTSLNSWWMIMAPWQLQVPSYSTAKLKLFMNEHSIENNESSSNAWLMFYKRVIWSSSQGYRVSLMNLNEDQIYCHIFMKTLVAKRSILTLWAWCKEIWSKLLKTRT